MPVYKQFMNSGYKRYKKYTKYFVNFVPAILSTLRLKRAGSSREISSALHTIFLA